MYIESVPNRDSPPAILLRESYREDGKVRKRTLANLSCLPDEVIEGLKVLMRGGVAVPSVEAVFTVEREPVPVRWTPRSTMSVIHGRPVRSLATNREPAVGG